MPTRKLSALALVLVLVVSVAGTHYAAAPSTATTSGNDASSGDSVTMIDSCTVINKSGNYELAENISGYDPGACIDIRASDVVLDGNSHTLDTSNTRYFVRGVRVNGTESTHNVTVRNLQIHGRVGLACGCGPPGLIVENASDVTIDNVTVEDVYVGIDVDESSDVTIRNVTAIGRDLGERAYGAVGIGSTQSQNVTIAESTVQHFSNNVFANGQNVTVRNNTLYHDPTPLNLPPGTAISVSASDSEIIGNDIIPTYTDVERESNAGDGIELWGNTSNTLVAENMITFGGRSGISINTTDTNGASNVISNNTIESTVIGVYVVQNSNPLSMEHNEFTDTGTGIRIGHQEGCYLRGANAYNVSAHHNAFIDTPVGVDNLDDGVVNATNNYWGASNGPSSANDTDAPFEDPETGTLADGDGSAVSEHPNEPGVSNVHFDTWLDEPPAEAGASTNETTTA